MEVSRASLQNQTLRIVTTAAFPDVTVRKCNFTFICNLLQIRSVPSLKIKSSCNPLILMCFVALLTSKYFLAISHIVACQKISSWPVKVFSILGFYNCSRKLSQSQFLNTLANILNMKSWGSFFQDNILIFIKTPLLWRITASLHKFWTDLSKGI